MVATRDYFVLGVGGHVIKHAFDEGWTGSAHGTTAGSGPLVRTGPPGVAIWQPAALGGQRSAVATLPALAHIRSTELTTPVDDLPAVATERIPPDPGVLKAIGLNHDLETAVADLVDNSIDAEAKRVHIRFELRGGLLHRMYVVDDGREWTRWIFSEP